MANTDGNTVTQVPSGLGGWVDYLTEKSLPLFHCTLSSVESLHDQSGKSVVTICEQLLLDPAAVATLLKLVNSKNKSRLSSEVTTLENAVIMIGVQKSRKALKRLEVIPIPANSPGLKAYLQTVVRAYHAGYQACTWAQTRGDMVVKESFVAAFMHYIGEMMMQLHGFNEMKAIKDNQVKEKLSYVEAQEKVLGFTFEDLSEEINKTWKMPEIVMDCFGDYYKTSNRIKGILLAVKVADLAEKDWYNCEMRECEQEFTDLFQWEHADIVRKLHEISILAARDSYHLGEITSASLLVRTNFEKLDEAKSEVSQEDGANKQKSINSLAENKTKTKTKTKVENNSVNNEKEQRRKNLISKLEGVNEKQSSSELTVSNVLSKLKSNEYQSNREAEIINDLLFCASKGLKIQRVIFFDYDAVVKQLKPTRFSDVVAKKQLEKMFIDVSGDSLFSRMLKKTSGLWLNDDNKDKFWHLVPVTVKGISNARTFYLMSINLPGVYQGLIYADGGNNDAALLTESVYMQFKKLCKLAMKCIEKSITGKNE